MTNSAFCLKVPYKVVGRRRGDVDSVYADVSLAAEELGWKAERGLEEMCTITVATWACHCLNKNHELLIKISLELDTFPSL